METDQLKGEIILAMMEARNRICPQDSGPYVRELVGAGWMEGAIWGIEHASQLIGPKAAEAMMDLIRRRDEIPDSSGRRPPGGAS